MKIEAVQVLELDSKTKLSSAYFQKNRLNAVTYILRILYLRFSECFTKLKNRVGKTSGLKTTQNLKLNKEFPIPYWLCKKLKPQKLAERN